MAVFNRPLDGQRAADALTDYFQQAGIEQAGDQLAALRRRHAVSLLAMLREAGTAGDLTIYDVMEGQALLIAQLEALQP
jgi:hypothetical protein